MKKLIALSLLTSCLALACSSVHASPPPSHERKAVVYEAPRLTIDLQYFIIAPALLPSAVLELPIVAAAKPRHADAWKAKNICTRSRALPKNKGPTVSNYAQSYGLAFS